MELRVVLLGLLASTAAWSQTFGEITGSVNDPSGASIPGATVRLTHQATGQSREAATNAAGNYAMPYLQPGPYNATVRKDGFKEARRAGITVQVGVVVRLDFPLDVGAVTETVEVQASSPLLSTDDAAVGTVIENRRILELPLNGRNFLQMIALSPNVAAEARASGHVDSRQGGERGRQPFAIAGQRIFFNHFTLDGVENTDVNYNTYVVRPSVDALQEFKVQTGIYPAEFGRAVSQINVTTKSGGNDFHGAVFEFLRNSALDAKEWQQVGDKNPFRRNQYGAVVSGRIIRNRLFFLSNWEGLRDVKTLQGLASVAPDAFRGGNFSQQPGTFRQIFDPLTRTYAVDASGNERATSAQPFPNGIIPQSRFHPIALKLLEFYPRQTQPGLALPNYVRQRPRNIDSDQFTQRFDFTESSKSTWFGRLSWTTEFEKRLENFEEQEGGVDTTAYQIMLANTRVLTPTIVNEFRFGVNVFQNDLILHYAYTRDVTSELGIQGLVPPIEAAWGTPAIQLGQGITNFGESGNGPWINRNATFQWMNNTSVVTGKHTLKFGFEIRRDRYNQVGNTVPRGRFYFGPNATADPTNATRTGHLFADYMLGNLQRAERALGLANAQLRTLPFYLYIDDTWKLTRKLTLNLGLRYENTPPWVDRYRGIMNIQMFGLQPSDRTPIYTRPGDGDFYEDLSFRFADGIPVQAGDDKMGRATIQRDNNDFAPRIGIAYSPTGRWTLRTGAGMFYTQDQGNPRFDMARNLAGRGDFTAAAATQRPNSSLDDPWKFERQTYPCTGWSGNCVGIPFVLGNVNSRRTTYVMQYLFNVQRQIGENFLLEFGYLGNIGRKLERLRSTNEPYQRTGPTDNRSIQQRRPFGIYGIIQQVDGVINSNYNAFNLKLQQRFKSGLTYLVGYTLSKSIDASSGIRSSTGENSVPMNEYDLRPERGLSIFDTRHRLVASILYEIPVPSSWNGAARFVLGGWQAGTIFTTSTGTPWRIGAIGDTNNIGGDGNYPDTTGISPFDGAGTAEKFWNIQAFDGSNRELQWRFGTSARNTLRTPGYIQWDASMMKSFRIVEGHTLQFRWETFNFTNHPNWLPPASNVLQPATFGRITSARTMREMQFALKYIF